MRVGIVSLLHESNTFIAEPTSFERFAEDLLVVGDDVRRRLEGTYHEVGGFFAGLDRAGIEAVPLFAARAFPYGPIADEALARLLDMMFAELGRAGKLDGVLAAPHGAAVSPSIPDVDGHWLTELRRRVGPDVPIVATLDPHANLSPAMVAACDATCAYRTNPHLDQHARGLEAAEWMARALRGELRLTMSAVHLPLIIDIERQCTNEDPCRGFCTMADALVAESPKLLGWSIVLGFPYADVAEMGTSVVFVADGDAKLAQKAANQLSRTIWERRSDLVGRHISIEEALDQAARLDGTVCLLDMGDNVGGGSPGDGTLLAQALHARGRGSSFVCLYDPESVRATAAAGIGKRVALRVGGKTDSLHGPSLEASFTVLGLFDGKFEETQPRHGGIKQFDQGPTAVVRSDRGLTIMLTSRRVPPFSLRQLTAFGIEPERFDALVAKGVNAPIAAYAPVARHMIRVDTPGVTAADVTRFTFQNRRRPMFPFEREANWEG